MLFEAVCICAATLISTILNTVVILKLSLIRCGITAAGIKAIAISIRHNHTLNWLNLADNNPRDDTSGVDEMIKTLQVNPSLRYLQVDIADLDHFMRINNLIRWHIEMDYWEQSMEADIIDKEAKLYSDALYKFARHQFTHSALYTLLKNNPLAFVGGATPSNRE